MAGSEVVRMMEALAAELEREGRPLDGAALEDLREAASRPEAAAEIQRLMEIEAASVQPGQPAPDFALPLLKEPDTRVRLSERWAERPVALIFGSYT